MFPRLIAQILITMSLIEMVPVDGTTFEYNAKLPTSSERSIVMDAYNLSVSASALPASAQRFPVKLDENSLGIVTTAQSVLVLDRETKMPLFQKNPDAVRPIGSITKLIAALVFLESSPDLSATAAVTSEDYRSGGRLYLALNYPVTVLDILKASLVGSDNSATMALVRLSGMTEEDFVNRMNAKANELKMEDTYFKEPTGLSPKNVSTAYDITKLLEAVIQEPLLREITQYSSVSIRNASGRTVTIPSTDSLLKTYVNESPYKVLAGKTGYLPVAGYGMGVAVGYENSGDVFIVVLGSNSKLTRTREVKGLATWVYKTFAWD